MLLPQRMIEENRRISKSIKSLDEGEIWDLDEEDMRLMIMWLVHRVKELSVCVERQHEINRNIIHPYLED